MCQCVCVCASVRDTVTPDSPGVFSVFVCVCVYGTQSLVIHLVSSLCVCGWVGVWLDVVFVILKSRKLQHPCKDNQYCSCPLEHNRGLLSIIHSVLMVGKGGFFQCTFFSCVIVTDSVMID